MNVKSQDVIMSCMGLGFNGNNKSATDMDTITMVADEYGFEVETLKEFAEEESDLLIQKKILRMQLKELQLLQLWDMLIMVKHPCLIT